MRLGMITSFPPVECGVATYSQYLTEALRAQGTDVYVICHRGGQGPQVFASFDYEDRDLAQRAFSATVRFTPDVVHIQHEFGLYGEHYSVAVVPLVIQFRLVGIPVVCTLHTVYANMPREHRILLEALTQQADRLIVHEEHQKATLERLYGSRVGSKVHVIPHGARLVNPVPEAKQRLGLPEDAHVMLVIGYFRPSKNFELAVDVFAQVARRDPQAVLVIAGKVRGVEHLEYRDRLFARINESPVRDRIWLLRGQFPQQTFDTVLSAADVVLLPYKITSQSGILAHCLALGRPVVTSNTPSMRQVMQRSGAGLVCQEPDEYVEAVLKLFSDPTKRAQMAENARNYVRREVAWPLVAQLHLEVYRQVVSSPKVHPEVKVVQLD